MVQKSKQTAKPYQTTRPSAKPSGGLLGTVAGILDPPRERPFIKPWSFKNPLNLFRYGLKQIPNTPRPVSRPKDALATLKQEFKRGSYERHKPVFPNWNRPRTQQPLDIDRGRGKREEKWKPQGTWPSDTKKDIPTPPLHVIPDWPGWPSTPIEDEPVPNIPDVPWEEPEEPLDKPKEVAKFCSDDPLEQALYKLPPCSLQGASLQIKTESKLRTHSKSRKGSLRNNTRKKIRLR